MVKLLFWLSCVPEEETLHLLPKNRTDGATTVALEKAMVKKDVKSKVAAKKWL